MPFSYKNKKEDVSLQVQKLLKKERAFLCTSIKGNLTVEAALVLPLFMLVTVSIMYFLVIIHIQLNIQIKLEDIAREMAKNAYVTEDLSVLNYVYVKAKMVDSEFEEYINKSYVVDGADGISLIESSFFGSDGVIDLVVTYDMVIPFISEKIVAFPCAQRIRFRTWIGDKMEQDDSETGEIVYITKTGTVYHTHRECTHLKLTISQTNYGAIDSLRNEAGGKYHKCSTCGKSGVTSGTIVYITEDGDKWHSSLTCSGLKRDVIEIEKSEVGDKPLCSRCGGED